MRIWIIVVLIVLLLLFSSYAIYKELSSPVTSFSEEESGFKDWQRSDTEKEFEGIREGQRIQDFRKK